MCGRSESLHDLAAAISVKHQEIGSMNTWELLSFVLVASAVGVLSGPWAALRRSTQSCGFEAFVVLVDRMNWSMAPVLTVLLPAAFLSLCVATFIALGESHTIFLLNGAALLLLSVSLLLAAFVEVPLVKTIATWPARLGVPRDWRKMRSRWLWVHRCRVALGFGSLVLVLVSAALSMRISKT